MARIPISPTTMMATHIIREKFLTRGNIFVIALSFILILLVPVSHAYHAGGGSSSHTMKGPIAIDNPDQILAGNSLQLIYIDALNCPYCEIFNAEVLPKFKETNLASQIYFTIINVDDFRNPREYWSWPEYLRWIPDKAELAECGPQFIAVMGRTVLGTYCHSNNFGKAKSLLNSLEICPIPKLRSSYASVSLADQFKIPQECFVNLSEEKVKQVRMNYKN